VGAVPGDDLVTPSVDGVAQSADLDGHRGVGEVADDVVDPGGGECRVGVVEYGADNFLSDNRPSGLGVSGVR